MNGVVGIILMIFGILAIIVSMIILCLRLEKYKKIVPFVAAIAIFIAMIGLQIAEHYQFYCCEISNFTDACKICGYEYSPNDKWICCNQVNYKKYCTECGNEKTIEENINIEDGYTYCCGSKYKIEDNKFCAACGEKLEKITEVNDS